MREFTLICEGRNERRQSEMKIEATMAWIAGVVSASGMSTSGAIPLDKVLSMFDSKEEQTDRLAATALGWATAVNMAMRSEEHG